MGSQSELFSRAAAYDRLMRNTADPVKKQALLQLRDTWILLANESPLLSQDTLITEIARIEGMEARSEEGAKPPEGPE